MGCRQVIDFLGEYLGGELSTLERLRFDAHLALCRQCRQYLETYKQTILMAKSSGEESLDEACQSIPEDLIRAILEARSGSSQSDQTGDVGKPPE